MFQDASIATQEVVVPFRSTLLNFNLAEGCSTLKFTGGKKQHPETYTEVNFKINFLKNVHVSHKLNTG